MPGTHTHTQAPCGEQNKILPLLTLKEREGERERERESEREREDLKGLTGSEADHRAQCAQQCPSVLNLLE